MIQLKTEPSTPHEVDAYYRHVRHELDRLMATMAPKPRRRLFLDHDPAPETKQALPLGWTDFKSVHITRNSAMAEKLSWGAKRAFYEGILLHEVGHLIWTTSTDSGSWRVAWYTRYPHFGQSFWLGFEDGLEDARINWRVMERWPGMPARSLRLLYSQMWDGIPDWDTHWDDTAWAHVWAISQALFEVAVFNRLKYPVLPNADVQAVIEDCLPFVQKLRNAATTAAKNQILDDEIMPRLLPWLDAAKQEIEEAMDALAERVVPLYGRMPEDVESCDGSAGEGIESKRPNTSSAPGVSQRVVRTMTAADADEAEGTNSPGSEAAPEAPAASAATAPSASSAAQPSGDSAAESDIPGSDASRDDSATSDSGDEPESPGSASGSVEGDAAESSADITNPSSTGALPESSPAADADAGTPGNGDSADEGQATDEGRAADSKDASAGQPADGDSTDGLGPNSDDPAEAGESQPGSTGEQPAESSDGSSDAASAATAKPSDGAATDNPTMGDEDADTEGSHPGSVSEEPTESGDVPFGPSVEEAIGNDASSGASTPSVGSGRTNTRSKEDLMPHDDPIPDLGWDPTGEGGPVDDSEFDPEAGDDLILTDDEFDAIQHGLDDLVGDWIEAGEADAAREAEIALRHRKTDAAASAWKPEGIHRNVPARIIVPDVYPEWAAQRKDEAAPMVRAFLRELKRLDASRDAHWETSQRRGQVDPRAVWQRSVGKSNYFRRRIVPDDQQDLAVLALLDASGSIDSDPRRYKAQILAGIMLGTVLRTEGVPHAVIAFNTDHPAVRHHVLIGFDQWQDPAAVDRVASFVASGANRDGYSIRWATDYLARQEASRSLMIVVSDGMPSDSGYGGSVGLQDTALAVHEAEKRGVTVLGVSIGNDHHYVPDIYPRRICLDNPLGLPKALGKSILQLIS